MSDAAEARKAAVERFIERVEDMVSTLASPDRVDLFANNSSRDRVMVTAGDLRHLMDAAKAGVESKPSAEDGNPFEERLHCIFCGSGCEVYPNSERQDLRHYVSCSNTSCGVDGPLSYSPESAVAAFLAPGRIVDKPQSRTVAIGEAHVRIEAGFLTPGVASFWARCKSSGKLETINEHATPAQLRELSALCLRSADEAEQAGREAGL